MHKVTEFENKIAEFFGAPYAVAVNSATSGLELVLRLKEAKYINCPRRTYLSVPMLAHKLNIELKWDDRQWEDYYAVYPDVFDAAVLWKRDSYIPGTYMAISFQYQKHLSLSGGGMILTDKYLDAEILRHMAHDGRTPNIPWREQNVGLIGYHYYMSPEIAQAGLDKLPDAIEREPRKWVITDWPDLTQQMDVFKK